MHRSIAHLSFADWVYFIFDHPAEGPHWYSANDAPFWNGPSALTAESCVQACESLFRKLFLPRCSPHLSHRDEPGRSPLNAVCYMWWDIMPVYGGPRLEDRYALHRAALHVMATVLDFESLACAESALHGLGHWHRAYPERVEGLIDGFLATHSGARPELLTYARSTRYAACCSVREPQIKALRYHPATAAGNRRVIVRQDLPRASAPCSVALLGLCCDHSPSSRIR